MKTIFIIFMAIIISTNSFSANYKSYDQEIVYIYSFHESGKIQTSDGQLLYDVKDSKLTDKINNFTSKEARVLFYWMAEKKMLVDISPASSPPFEISSPNSEKTFSSFK